MSSAICFNCGKEKVEPLKRCSGCGAKPASEENMMLSVMLTPEMLSPEGLANSATLIKAGKRLAVKDEMKGKIADKLRSMGVTVSSPAPTPAPQQQPPPQARSQPQQPQRSQPPPQQAPPPRQQQAQPAWSPPPVVTPPQQQAHRPPAPPRLSNGPSLGYRLGQRLRPMLPGILIVGLFVLAFLFLHPWPHFKLASLRDTVSSYEGFLKRYPSGTYAYEAKDRLRLLKEPNAWAAVDGSSDINKLREYRNTYPDGKHLAEAKTQIQAVADAKWAKVAQSRSLREINGFFVDYPESEKKFEAKKRIEELHRDFQWVKEQDSLAVYQKFLELFPNHAEKTWIEKRIIDLEVKQIAAGEYGELPPSQPTSLGGVSAEVKITNDTGYELTVRYSGPDSQKVVIPIKESKSISLAPGMYKVAASVNASNVTNYYGSDELRGGNYTNSFYIQTDTFGGRSRSFDSIFGR